MDNLSNVLNKNRSEKLFDFYRIGVSEIFNIPVEGIFIYSSVNWGGYPATRLGVVVLSADRPDNHGVDILPILGGDLLDQVGSRSVKVRSDVHAVHNVSFTLINSSSVL